jgi:hypothetical protein
MTENDVIEWAKTMGWMPDSRGVEGAIAHLTNLGHKIINMEKASAEPANTKLTHGGDNTKDSQ